jgi:acyl CoA:acetate/3-ketoacid CoA transferase alpha subunit
MDVLESGKGKLICPPNPDEVRSYLRENKSYALVDKQVTHKEAISRLVKPNDYLGIELYGTVRCPLSLTREIVRQNIGSLRFVGQGVLEADYLLAAGLISEMDHTYIGWEVFGTSPVLRRVAESGKVKITEWSNAALSWRMIAGAMGLPFIPTKSMLGSDTFKYSAAKVVKDPFTGEKVCLLPATFSDVGMIHVHKADIHGNCEIEGISGFAPEMARSSKKLIISCEEIVDTEYFRKNPDRNIIPYFLTDAVVHAPFGSHPGEMNYKYWRDNDHLKSYYDQMSSVEGTKAYLDEWIYDLPDHDSYLKKIGKDHLRKLESESRGR